MKQYLEAGVVATTHGGRGELKVYPWTDSPEFLRQFRRIYIDKREYAVESVRIQKSMNLVKLEGVDDVDQAMRFRGKVIFIDRDDAKLEEGKYFVQDLIGLTVYDLQTEKEIGKLKQVQTLPAGDIYIVRDGEKEYMIPVNPVFVKENDVEGGVIRVETIKGMLGDE